MARTMRAAFRDAGIEPEDRGLPEVGGGPGRRPRPRLTAHAVKRYRERVKPAVSEGVAHQELDVLLDRAEIVDTPPPWARTHANSPFFAILSDGIIAAASPSWHVTTILIRGGVSERVRVGRRERKARARRARRLAAGSDPDPPPGDRRTEGAGGMRTPPRAAHRRTHDGEEVDARSVLEHQGERPL